MRRQSREGRDRLEEKQRLLPCYCKPKKTLRTASKSPAARKTQKTQRDGAFRESKCFYITVSISTFRTKSRFFSVAPVDNSVRCYPLHATGLQQTCEFITDVHSWPHAWRICVKASFYGILPHSVLSHAGTTPASLSSQTLCPLTPHQGRPWITKACRLQQA